MILVYFKKFILSRLSSYKYFLKKQVINYNLKNVTQG